MSALGSRVRLILVMWKNSMRKNNLFTCTLQVAQLLHVHSEWDDVL